MTNKDLYFLLTHKMSHNIISQMYMVFIMTSNLLSDMGDVIFSDNSFWLDFCLFAPDQRFSAVSLQEGAEGET